MKHKLLYFGLVVDGHCYIMLEYFSSVLNRYYSSISM